MYSRDESGYRSEGGWGGYDPSNAGRYGGDHYGIRRGVCERERFTGRFLAVIRLQPGRKRSLKSWFSPTPNSRAAASARSMRAGGPHR